MRVWVIIGEEERDKIKYGFNLLYNRVRVVFLIIDLQFI